MAKKMFESFRVESMDDGTFSIDFRPVEKKNDEDSPMSFHDNSKSMTASSFDEMIEKVKKFKKGNNAVKDFLTDEN